MTTRLLRGGAEAAWLLQTAAGSDSGLLPWPILRVAATSSFPLAYRLPNPLVSLHTSTHDSRGDPAAMLAPHPRVRSSSSSMRTPSDGPISEFPPARSMCASHAEIGLDSAPPEISRLRQGVTSRRIPRGGEASASPPSLASKASPRVRRHNAIAEPATLHAT